MKSENELISFMRVCIDNEEIPKSWQITNIKISKSWISFEVNGYKYKGSIQIEVVENEYLIKADGVEICSASSAIEAVAVLDYYIELDYKAYDRLRNMLKI